MLKYEGLDKRILVFHPKYQGKIPENELENDSYDEVYKIISKSDDDLIELEFMLGNIRKSFSDCLWYMMQKKKWITPEIFNENTGLYKNLHGEIKNNRPEGNNLKRDSLITVCVGLELNLRIIYKVFEKANLKLNPYGDPDKTYINIKEGNEVNLLDKLTDESESIDDEIIKREIFIELIEIFKQCNQEE